MSPQANSSPRKLDQPVEWQSEVLLESNARSLPDESQLNNPSLLAASHRRLQWLYEMGCRICGETDLQNVLREAVHAVVTMTSAERCHFLMLDGRNELSPLKGHPDQLSGNIDQWPISKTVVMRVLKTKQPLLSSDALADLADAPSVREQHIRSVMCVPLGPQGGQVGVIYADSKAEAGSFTELDLRFLAALSHFVYVAIRAATIIQQAHEHRELSDARCEMYQEELFQQHQIVGVSKGILRAYGRIRAAAVKNVSLLLIGETGTGKELFAKAAHRLSKRKSGPFIPINIVAFSREVIESELFGHVEGAFTGALRDKKGRFALADKGTLFLDEIGLTPLDIQGKLLRALEEKKVERVGDEKATEADVRLICATNIDLLDAVKKGDFRDDLYYRIAGVTVMLPPLRERCEDIPHLVTHLQTQIGSNKRFSPEASLALQSYQWPGNIRQLLRVLEEVDAICPSDTVTLADLPDYIVTGGSTSLGSQTGFKPMKELVVEVEKEHMRLALTAANGNNEKAIKLLGVGREQYFRKKQLYGLSDNPG